MSKFKFMHTFSESKGIFAIEQKAIVSYFVKTVTFLLGHPVVMITFVLTDTEHDMTKMR